MQTGHYYHIYNRGINKDLLFFENMNYSYFLKQFDNYLKNFVDVFSYCLMPNHFHFLIRVKKTSEVSETSEVLDPRISTNLTPLEKSFKDFFISYAKAINKKYQRTGSLFQAKFKKKLIDSDGYLPRLIAYIHLNPVRAKLCNEPEEWKYSSYGKILGSQNSMLKTSEVIKIFGSQKDFVEFHKNYRDSQRERELLFNSEDIKILTESQSF